MMWLIALLSLLCSLQVKTQELVLDNDIDEVGQFSSNILMGEIAVEFEASPAVDEGDLVSSNIVPDSYIARFDAKARNAIALMLLNNEGREGMAASINSTLELSDDSLYLDYGVESEQLDQPLLVGPEKELHYRVLVNTPHGRHLLMISLLERLNENVWTEKCGGKLKIFLPESLRLPYQPVPPPHACLLEDIVINNKIVEREEVMDKFVELVPQESDFEVFSWFDNKHKEVIKGLANWVLDQETFGSSYSLLVTIKDRMTARMFVELVNLVMTGMEGTGFVMPSLESYMPEDFFTEDTLASFYANEDSNDGDDNVGRVRRQAGGNSLVLGYYFREDPVANSHHTDWHRLGGGWARWGEFFYYMHNQMLARYESERISLGLGFTTYYGPGQWELPVNGYNPNMIGWDSRPPGRNWNYWGLPAGGRIQNEASSIQNQARRDALNGFFNGVDLNINGLGQSMEYSLHNSGHMAIAGMTSGNGVMGSAQTAMRDPIFYRWHGFVDSVFQDYKNNLGLGLGYPDADLSFPGVTSVTAYVEAHDNNGFSSGLANNFYTYMEMTSISLSSSLNSPGNAFALQYSRMNHRPFRWNIEVTSILRDSTPAIVRVFIMPTEGGLNRATIHMDHFFTTLNPGLNKITRYEMDAPHLSSSRWSLTDLQRIIMNGQISGREFSWGGCGWPRHLNVPRGTESGMAWDMVVMVSQVLPQDRRSVENWNSNSQAAWSYCGVRFGQVPDSRPLGFPTDRSFEGDIQNLVGGRENWAVVPVTIVHGSS